MGSCPVTIAPRIGGEGVLGLQRAFPQAGASTTVRMDEFYGRLAALSKKTKLQRCETQRHVFQHLNKVIARAEKITAEIAARGLGKAARMGPPMRMGEDRRSPVSWWAGFVLSGDIGVKKR